MKVLWVTEDKERSDQSRRSRGTKPKVTVVELQRSDFPVTITSEGVVKAHNSTSLTPRVSGRVLSINPEFESGGFFKKDDILLELDPTDFDAAVAAAEARLARADAALAQEIARGEQARADWKDLGYEGEPSSLVLREPQMREAKANFKAATADLESAHRDLDRCQVRAPYDGCVLDRLVGLGQSVSPGTQLGEIFSTDYAEIRLALASPDLPYFSLPEEQEEEIHVTIFDALDLESGKTWEGRVVRTEGALAESSRELFVVGRVVDPYGLEADHPPLRIGQPVHAEINGRVLEDVFVLPRASLRGPSEVILLDPEELTITRTEINPVWSDAGHVVVRDELPEGWLLVTSSLSYAADGSKVEIQESTSETEMGEIKAARKESDGNGRPGRKRKPGA